MRGWIGSAVLVALIGWAAVASAGNALDKPAFTAAPGELLAVARAATRKASADDGPLVVLRAQTDTSYDDRGRATRRRRSVYVVRSQPEDDDGNPVDATWSPSYQDRPVVRARVIGPAGEVTELDPAQVTDAADRAPGPEHDRRGLEVKLPPTQSGSIVEYEVVTADREPRAGGRIDVHRIGCDAATGDTVISYSAPSAHKLHRVERKLPRGVRARHEVAGGRDRWTYEIPARLPCDPFEAEVPADVVTWPYIGVATAASWQAVARDYRKRVDQQIADSPVELPAELPRTASLPAIEAIAAWLHRQVRHPDLDLDLALGEVSVTPSPPAETVKRGAGGSFDQATLLVALLRQAQIRADLALLPAFAGREIDPDLPGISELDHAIVLARLGSREVWIDPTEDLLRPGQLPARDQGRRALVIADDTVALVTTPRDAPGDNRFREVRSFSAAEWGPSQLTLVTRATGVLDAEQRRWFRDVQADHHRKQYAAIATEWFGGTFERVSSTAADDLAVPFEITLAVAGARRVFSDRERIEIYLSPRSVLRRVPPVVLRSDAPRSNDFGWSTPHVYEVENRITVPAGFTLPPPGPDRLVPLGTATFSERRWIEGQTLVVAFRFETGKPRLSPAELAELQAALQKLNEETVHLSIDRTAFALADAGKLREAITEAERLIALHPREALHRSQLAELLVRAGAGEAARREARKAVALAPDEADPEVVLGWVLHHDRLGRDFTYDWDRAGTIAALQKARTLDPRHVGALVELARVLQRGSSGALFEHDADLRGAAEAWRAALELDHDDALELAQLLIWSGQEADAETVARATAVSEERDRWIVTAVAAARGAEAAVKAAADLRSGEERDHLIGYAASIMLLRQRYAVARALLAEIKAPGPLTPGWTGLVARVTEHPDVAPGSADPRTAVTDLLLAVADPDRKTPVFWDAALERQLRGVSGRLAPPTPRRFSASRFLGDILLSGATIHVEGEAGLWRASITGKSQLVVYLALDHGIAKAIGVNGELASVGRYLLQLPAGAGAGAGNEAPARRLLDWVRADIAASTERSAIQLRRVWGQGLPSSAGAIQLAAAVLAGTSEPDRAIAIAARCPAASPDGRLACRELLASAYLARERWADAVAQLEAIQADRPDEIGPYIASYAWALARCGRFDDADRLLDDVLARSPDDADALLSRYAVARERGQPAEASRRLDAVTQRPHPTPFELNNTAWFRLVDGSDLTTAVELAHRAVDGAPDSLAARNTLAAIEAELGDVELALADNRKVLALRPSGEPTDSDWYVAARIDEELGLTADATAIYARIAKPGTGRMTANELASRRLAVLRRTR